MKRNIILTAAIAAIALIGWAALMYFPGTDHRHSDQKAALGKPAYRSQMDGLNFHATKEGRPVISIKADRFTLGRGRFGFFSTGLTRRAMIQNAVIEIYTNAPSLPLAEIIASPSPSPKDAGKPSPANTPGNSQPEKKFDLSGLFDENTFSSLLSARNIAELEISPITVRLRNTKEVLSTISASRASLHLRDKKIRFTGQVRVSSGNETMTTDELTVGEQCDALLFSRSR